MSLLIKETQQAAYFSVLWPGHAEMKDHKVIKKLDFWPQTLNTVLLLPLDQLKRDN